ncbi:unnamed protein product [Gongylonema pulchrum]|uniref:SET domain-containing protein n=1 Tax=Gongylonema pulchrum TaxID=637853 RepID=A0A183D1U5_9BILA|nr:unnamed protein product [Gongylonema pulchrum]
MMEIKANRSDLMKDYYIDVPAMLQKPGTVGNKSHPSLSNSYRRAVAAKIQFDFPFYGHRMRNLTIATGADALFPTKSVSFLLHSRNATVAAAGFAYIGDQSHSWLAATQYIAPLMANFDTHGENATIMYADDGEKFVIEWSNLQLREQRSDTNVCNKYQRFTSSSENRNERCLPIPSQCAKPFGSNFATS